MVARRYPRPGNLSNANHHRATFLLESIPSKAIRNGEGDEIVHRRTRRRICLPADDPRALYAAIAAPLFASPRSRGRTPPRSVVRPTTFRAVREFTLQDRCQPEIAVAAETHHRIRSAPVLPPLTKIISRSLQRRSAQFPFRSVTARRTYRPLRTSDPFKEIPPSARLPSLSFLFPSPLPYSFFPSLPHRFFINTSRAFDIYIYIIAWKKFPAFLSAPGRYSVLEYERGGNHGGVCRRARVSSRNPARRKCALRGKSGGFHRP